MKLCVYDHSSRWADVAKKDWVAGSLESEVAPLCNHGHIVVVCRADSEQDAAKTLGSCGADAIIGHFRDDNCWRSLVDAAKKAGSCCIRTSSVGRRGHNHAITDRGVIELNLQARHSSLKTADWKQIIDALGDVESARNVAHGFVPAGLEQYFATTAPEHLVALLILCQGYLAVLNPAALGMANRFKVAPAILDEAKKAVQSPCWWLEVLDPGGKAKTSAELVDIGKEWPKPSDAPMEAHWTKIHEFLDALLTARKDKVALEQINLAKLAEQAYVAVRARLVSVEAANNA